MVLTVRAPDPAHSDRYESKSEADGIESLSKKLTTDLRKHIRSLGPYPVMSDKWRTMADSLARIANISDMERKLPKDKEEATLWECEELALRYLLEDGKLNLCLRLLQQYRAYLAENGGRGGGEAGGAGGGAGSDGEVLLKFEKGLGTLLKNAWMHVEALQTTDLPLLIEHIGAVLSEAAEGKLDAHESLEGLQAAVALHYLLAFGKHLDDVDESRVMPFMLENDVIKHAIVHLHRNHARLPPDDLAAGAEGLALLVDSEEFKTFSERFVGDGEAPAALAALKDDFLSEMTSESAVRRKLRPLLDLCERTTRSLAK